MLVLEKFYNTAWFYLILIIVIFGVIAAISFLILKLTQKKDKKNEKPTDEQIAEENVNRYLEEINDEDIINEFNTYSEDIKDEENKEK